MGQRTDQILPPQLPGFVPAKIFPLTGAQPAKARELWSQGGDVNFLHTTSSTSVALAQIAKYNLEQAGFKVNLKPQPFGVAINTMGTKGNEIDAFSIAWIADYFDPYDFINVLLDGRNIQEKNNNNYSYWNNAKYNRLMDAASKLTGQGPLRGLRQARRRHLQERGPVDPGVHVHLAGLRQPAGGELHLPPRVRQRRHQRDGDQEVTQLEHGGAGSARPAVQPTTDP